MINVDENMPENEEYFQKTEQIGSGGVEISGKFVNEYNWR